MLDSIEISNLCGFDEYKAKFSDVTLISGGNEQGKSSILRIVASLFQGGGDAGLLKVGTKEGLVSYSFTNGYRPTKKIHPSVGKGYTLYVEDPNGGKITSGAATMVSEWLPKSCFDVRELVRMIVHDPSALEKYMLANWPVTFEPDELNKPLRGMLPLVMSTKTLAEVNAMRTTLYDTRTTTKADAKEAMSSLRSLQAAIGAGDDKNWATERNRLQSELTSIAASLASIESDIKREAEEAKANKRQEATAESSDLSKACTEYTSLVSSFHSVIKSADPSFRESMQDAANRIHSGFAKFIANIERQYALAGELATFVGRVDQAEKESITEQTADLLSQRETLSKELGMVQEKADQQQRSLGLRSQVDAQQKRMDGHATKETMLDAAIQDIDRLKASKLAEFPISGLDINLEGKQPVITINGKSLSENINTQNQIKIAVQFIAEAQRRSGCTMRIIVCEGAELDTDHLVELAEICRGEKIQLIVSTLRTKQPLRVESLESFLSREKSLVEVPA